MNEDIRLIRKIQRSGDRAAADALVRRYYDEIHRFVRHQTTDADMALDLTQEVFISMLRTIARYNPKQGAGFRTWLYKIATNKLVDHYRSRTARPAEALCLDEVEPVDGTDFTARLEDRDFTERVCAFVDTLPADTQKVFRLHIFGGLTFLEISKNLQIPESSVKSRYYRLIHTLRKEFGSHD